MANVEWQALLPASHRARVTTPLDWQTAIRTAARVLVEEGAIDEEYVDAMIETVETYGPYIVLDEGLAMPHAKPSMHVHRLSMSLLQVSPAVDVMGKPVDVFLVLASPDTTAHLTALSALGALLGDGSRRDVLRFGTDAEIGALLDSAAQG